MDPPLRQYYTSGGMGPGERCDDDVEKMRRYSSVAAAPEALPFRGPIHKPLHVIAVLPGKTKELARRQISRFLPEKCLKAPANVRALPGLESIAASGIPVILHGLKHFALW